MKIIEAMKQIKDLQQKADDLRGKVLKYCADIDLEQPTYGSVDEQREQIKQWVQAHSDVLKEILRLRVAIQRTNLATEVEIQLGDNRVTKTIAEWIHRRRDLAGDEQKIYAGMTQKGNGLQMVRVQGTTGETKDGHPRRYFDQAEVDAKTEALRSEPMKIDGTLEVVNATTDLIEA